MDRKETIQVVKDCGSKFGFSSGHLVGVRFKKCVTSDKVTELFYLIETGSKDGDLLFKVTRIVLSGCF